MTWTKLGGEWRIAARDLSDAAYRTHTDALCWSNDDGLDLMIPKRDLKRFAETANPDAAVAELVETGWWQDCGPDGWYIGCRFSEWQLESSVVAKRKEATALRVRRHRAHNVGDHSLCDPSKECVTQSVTRYVTRDDTRYPVRDGSGREKALKKELLGCSGNFHEPSGDSREDSLSPHGDECPECDQESERPGQLCDDCTLGQESRRGYVS